MAEKYITEEQRAGCQKVADAFAELYELTDVVVADAGRFGFVRLQWFSEGEGFDSAMAFSDSGELFEELWRIWYEHEVLSYALPLMRWSKGQQAMSGTLRITRKTVIFGARTA